MEIEGKDNEAILNALFQGRKINIDKGRLFGIPTAPKSPAFNFARVEGMLLGVAIGDALGITSEGNTPRLRHGLHGEIRDYIPNRYVDEARGFPSDDTQLSFWALEQLIKDEEFIPANVAKRFATGGRIFGIGSTMKEFLTNFKSGKAWYECGPKSAGNGAIMRIAPFLVPHLHAGGTGLWVDTALAAMMTHNDRGSISACLAFIALLWELLDKNKTPPPEWWIERYVEVACDLEGDTHFIPRGGVFSDYRGPIWLFVREKVAQAYRDNLPVVKACDQWYSGAFLLETVPSVLYILMRYADDPEEAIVRAVNDTKDNDTIASIVGAAIGALHGRDGIPERWITNLSGRTTVDDDGRIFDLIREARTTFWND